MQLALLSIGRQQPPPAEILHTLEPEWTHSATNAASVDQGLDLLGSQRLVIDAVDLGALNLVLARLMRRGGLAEVDTAILLDAPLGYLGKLGLPRTLAGQLAIARRGVARFAGVLKDDSGGLCVDTSILSGWQDDSDWWVRAVVDDQRLADGNARSLSVHRVSPSELAATVRLGRMRTSSRRGRSLQLACDPAHIVADGVPRDRPRSKRIFWAEPSLWRLALP